MAMMMRSGISNATRLLTSFFSRFSLDRRPQSNCRQVPKTSRGLCLNARCFETLWPLLLEQPEVLRGQPMVSRRQRERHSLRRCARHRYSNCEDPECPGSQSTSYT